MFGLSALLTTNAHVLSTFNKTIKLCSQTIVTLCINQYWKLGNFHPTKKYTLHDTSFNKPPRQQVMMTFLHPTRKCYFYIFHHHWRMLINLPFTTFWQLNFTRMRFYFMEPFLFFCGVFFSITLSRTHQSLPVTHSNFSFFLFWVLMAVTMRVMRLGNYEEMGGFCGLENGLNWSHLFQLYFSPWFFLTNTTILK